VSLWDPKIRTPEFIIPGVDSEVTFAFQLTITDSTVATDTDQLNITITLTTTTAAVGVQFDDGTTQNGSTTVTVDSVRFGNRSVPGEKFVVVIHETSNRVYESVSKIGESEVLFLGDLDKHHS
jgi:hypothetical protein